MDYLKQIQFYIDGFLTSPRNLKCDFNNRSLTYNLELEDDYLEKNDGRFFFTAKFTAHILCDIKLQDRMISIACSPHDSTSHNILFDGFSYTENGIEKTKSICLKSLQRIRESINDPDQIKRAEEQKSELNISIYKCHFPDPCKKPDPDDNQSLCGDISKAVFVEALQLNSIKKTSFDFIREKKIMSFKIVFNAKLVEVAEDKTIRVL